MDEQQYRAQAVKMLAYRDSVGPTVAGLFRSNAKRYLIQFVCLLLPTAVLIAMGEATFSMLLLGMAVGLSLRDYAWFKLLCATWPFTLRITDWQKVQQLADEGGLPIDESRA